jgi:hypothetical protein
MQSLISGHKSHDHAQVAVSVKKEDSFPFSSVRADVNIHLWHNMSTGHYSWQSETEYLVEYILLLVVLCCATPSLLVGAAAQGRPFTVRDRNGVARGAVSRHRDDVSGTQDGHDLFVGHIDRAPGDKRLADEEIHVSVVVLLWRLVRDAYDGIKGLDLGRESSFDRAVDGGRDARERGGREDGTERAASHGVMLSLVKVELR